MTTIGMMTIGSTTMTTIEDLEAEVNKIYGSGQFDWTIGRSPEGWFFFAGTLADKRWRYSGLEPTIEKALKRLIAMGSTNVF